MTDPDQLFTGWRVSPAEEVSSASTTHQINAPVHTLVTFSCAGGTMDDFDEDSVGYKKPPKKHRFSQFYQPKRASAKVDADCALDMRETLRENLLRDLKILRNGRNTKISIVTALGEKFVRAGLRGNIDDMAKLMKILKEFGVFEDDGKLKYLQREWNDERASLDGLIITLRDGMTDMLQIVRDTCSEKIWLADGYLEADSKCTCGAFGDDAALVLAIRQMAEGSREVISLDPQDPPEMRHWGVGHVSDPTSRSSARSDTDRPRNDNPGAEPNMEDEFKNEFYTGMLGAEDLNPPTNSDEGDV